MPGTTPAHPAWHDDPTTSPDVEGSGPRSEASAECAHLVIGLGAVGRATIARLQRIFDRGRPAADHAPPPTEYVAIDVEDASGQAAWAGSRLMRPAETSVFTLDMASVRTLTGLTADVRSWLSRYDAALDLGSDTVTNPRRLGSLLLAAKAAELQEVLDRQAEHLLARCLPAARLQIHVVGYLADGIGGGALTQLLVQIRRNAALAGCSQVAVYGLLPESGEQAVERDREAAAVNAGAALTELSGAQRRRERRAESAEPQELGFNRLCDEILVIAPPRETGRIARDLKMLPEAMAMAVRQRMLVAARVAARHPSEDTQRRPIVAVVPKVLTTGRDEIEDALALSLLQAALAQCLYANWNHRRGFLHEPRRFAAGDHVRRPDVQNRWMLSADHLIQSAPVLPDDGRRPQWRQIAEDWTLALTGIVELAEGQPRHERLDCITRLCTQRYREDFRQVGVPTFYRNRQARRRDIAQRIAATVEADLFGQWRSGDLGIHDIHQMLKEVIEQQRQRLASIDERVANIRMSEEACRVRILAANQEWRRRRNRSDWLPWNWFRRETDPLLHTYGTNLQELHVNMTRAEGWLFAKSLLPVLIEELERLLASVERLLRGIAAGAREVDLLLEELSSRLDGSDSATSFISYLFDPQKLQRVVQDMLSAERFQTACADTVRAGLAGDAGEAEGFRTLARRVEDESLLRTLFASCRSRIERSADHWAAAAREVLATSVFDVVERQAGSDFGVLRDVAARYTTEAAALLPPSIDGTLGTRLYIGLPSHENGSFPKSLRSAFSFSRRSEVAFVDRPIGENMIHLMLVTAPFSIPDIELLRQMDRHYRSYVQRDRDYAMLSLHAIGVKGDGAEEFSIGEDPRSTTTLAALLVGLALGIVVERSSAEADGRAALWLVPKDEDGFDDDPVHLAEDLLSAGTEIVGTVASMLEDNAKRTLERAGIDTGRLIDMVVERVVAIRRRCNDNPADPVYRAFVEAGKAAAKLIRQHGARAEEA